MHKILKIYRYAQGLAGLNKNDILLASFPKSGVTWLRFFLFQLLRTLEPDDHPLSWRNLDNTLPELGRQNLLDPWPYASLPRFVKTHKNNLPFFGKCRSVLLVRDPRDVMVSFYCYQKAKTRNGFTGTFSRFIRHKKFGLPAWNKHYRSWRDRCTMMLTYEDMLNNDIEVFTGLFQQLNIKVPAPYIKTAAENTRFSKLRELENHSGTSKPRDFFQPDYKFTRKGVAGDWKNYFTGNDLLYYEKYIRQNDQGPAFYRAFADGHSRR